MHDARLVGRFEASGDLADDVERLVDAQRPTGQPLRQVLPGDQLHGQKGRAVDAKDLSDVGMVEARQGPGLTLEAAQAVLVGCKLGGKDVERGFASEARVAGASDFAHGAGAKRYEGFVVGEGLAGQRGMGVE